MEDLLPCQVWVAPGRVGNSRIEAHRLTFVPGEDKVFVAYGTRSAASTAIWDLRSGEVEHIEGTIDGDVKAVAVTPAGQKWVATADVQAGPGAILLRDVGPRGRGTHLYGPRSRCNQAVFSHDGEFLASTFEDGTAVVWDLTTGLEARFEVGATAGPVGFSPDARWLVAAGTRISGK